MKRGTAEHLHIVDMCYRGILIYFVLFFPLFFFFNSFSNECKYNVQQGHSTKQWKAAEQKR